MQSSATHYYGNDVTTNSSVEVVDLSRSEVDVAIRYGVRSDYSLVVNRLLVDLNFPVCSPSMLSSGVKLLRVDDLNNVPLIHCDISKIPWAQQTRRWFNWDSWLKHVGAESVATDDGLCFSD